MEDHERAQSRVKSRQEVSLSSPGYPDGTRIRVTHVLKNSGLDGELLAIQDGKEGLLKDVHVEILVPDHDPGTILKANGMLWVVRRSAKHVSYRVQPVDLTTRLVTLPIEVFYARYPKARVLFDPRTDIPGGNLADDKQVMMTEHKHVRGSDHKLVSGTSGNKDKIDYRDPVLPYHFRRRGP